MPAMLGEIAKDCIDMAHLPAQPAALIARLQQQVQAQAREIAWTQAKLEKVNFELARLKRWKFGTKTEAMTAQQRAPVPGGAGRGRGQPTGATGCVATLPGKGVQGPEGATTPSTPPGTACSPGARRAS